MQQMLCPECSGTAVSPEGTVGEKVCTNCGLVIEETQVTRHHSNWNPQWPSSWSKQDSETLREWLTELRLVSCQLNIPTFPYREEAARLIRKQKHLFFQSQRLAKNKRETVAALLQLILKQYGKQQSVTTICQQLSLNKELVMKQNWNLTDQIRTKTQLLPHQTKTPKNYLYNYGTKITHNPQLLNQVQENLAKIQKKGGNPISLAAGALYYTCKKERIRITKETIGKAFSISARTVDTNERKIRRLITTTTKHLQLTTITPTA